MNKRRFFLVLLVLISVIPLLDLTKPGMYQSHDFVEHAARLASFYQSLKEGNLIPRWGGDLNYGYGHPVLMFFYPLTNYLSSIIHFLGFSIIDSIKILFALSYIASGLFMFLWISQFWSLEAGFVSAIFYLFAPYRFVNLYVRAALGEHLAFAFVPATFWMSTNLVKKPKRRYLVFSALALALLILSHNAVSLMFLPLILIYAGYLIFCQGRKRRALVLYYTGCKANIPLLAAGMSRRSAEGGVAQPRKKKPHPLAVRSLHVLACLILGLALSAFFWLPAFIEAKYTLRDIVTTREIYKANFINWKELFVSPWDYGLAAEHGKKSGFSVQIGWAHWVVFFVSSFSLFANRKKDRGLLLLAVLFFIGGAYLTTTFAAPFLAVLPLIHLFQFPWRLLALPLFTASLMAGYLTELSKSFRLLLVLSLGLGVILSTTKFWHIKGIDEKYASDSDIASYARISTTETGVSTPRWTIRSQESFPPAKVQLVWGKLDQVRIEKWQSQYHQYWVKVSEDSQIVDNTLYFPGWKVWVDGIQVPINFHDMNWRGIITFPVSKGEHKIMVKFTHTRVRLLSELISLTSAVFIAVVLIWPDLRHLRGGGFIFSPREWKKDRGRKK